jgi:hypothetical protein
MEKHDEPLEQHPHKSVEHHQPQPLADVLKGCWVLFLFSYSAALQSLLWVMPGATSTSLASVYSKSFGPNSVQQFFIIGSCAFIPATFISVYACERFGVRVCTIANAFILAGIAGLRFGAQANTDSALVLWQLSAVLVGLSGPITLAVPSILAELWFPPERRATATAVAVEAGTIGSALGYLLPLMLPAATLTDVNRMYALSAGLALLLLACCCYFPAGPSVPPSRSAAATAAADEAAAALAERPEGERAEGTSALLLQDEGTAPTAMSMTAGAVPAASSHHLHATHASSSPAAVLCASLHALSRNPPFLVIVGVYGVTLGMNGAWLSTLNLNLRHAGLS